MKKVTIIILLFSFLTLSAQVDQRKWDYPVKPGTEKWKNLEDNAAKVNACQIPESVLLNISTEDLFQLVMDYPLIYDIYAFSNVNEGLDKLLNDFNGIRELFKRKEATKLFSDHYIKKINEINNILDNPESKDEGKGREIMYLSLLETLGTCSKLQKVMSLSDIQSIVNALKVGVEIKMSRPDYFSGFGFETIIESAESLQSIQKFDLSKANNSDTDYYSPVLTPFGSVVSAWKTFESNIVVRASFDSYYSASYPNASLIYTYDGYSSTRRFNCHGYAWHRVEHGNNPSEDVWIGYDPDLEELDPEKRYITDGSYNQLSNPVTNCKIVWSEGDHTAVNIDNTWCISKWNAWPLMRHRIGDSPFGNNGLKYYYYNYNLNINGPDYVNDESIATYSLNNPPQGTLSWSVTNNLQIVSGQNSTQLKVKPALNGIGSGKITVTINTLSSDKNVDVNYPRVRAISGPTTGSVGQTLYFNAEPIYPASMGQYVWSISPSSATLTTWQWQSYFSTTSPGSYMISCYFRSNTGTQSHPVTLFCNVSSGWRVFLSERNLSIENNQLLQKGGVKKVNYILYSQGGGVVAKGLIVNGQLRINNLPYPSGIYILQIVEEPGVYETFKIIL